MARDGLRDSLDSMPRRTAGTRLSRSPLLERYGGGACESNTPGTLFTPHYGFEDRGAHQDPSASAQDCPGEGVCCQCHTLGTAKKEPRVCPAHDVRSTRTSPSRLVRPAESKYSSSGIANLRLTPRTSRS